MSVLLLAVVDVTLEVAIRVLTRLQECLHAAAPDAVADMIIMITTPVRGPAAH